MTRTGDRTFVRQGTFGQWWDAGSHRSTAKRSWEGLREVYLLPFFAVGQLDDHFQRLPDPARERWGRSIQRRVHYGYHDKSDSTIRAAATCKFLTNPSASLFLQLTQSILPPHEHPQIPHVEPHLKLQLPRQIQQTQNEVSQLQRPGAVGIGPRVP